MPGISAKGTNWADPLRLFHPGKSHSSNVRNLGKLSQSSTRLSSFVDFLDYMASVVSTEREVLPYGGEEALIRGLLPSRAAKLRT